MDFVVNFIPVIIIAVLFMPVGAFVYSSKGFGNMWLDAIGKTEEEIKNEDNNMAVYMGGAFVSSLLTVYLLALLIENIGVASIGALFIVVIIVYFIVLLIRLKSTLFDGNFKLFQVNLIGTFLEFIVAFVVFALFL